MMERPLVTPESFLSRLAAISERDGIPYSRAYLILEEEEKHAQAILQYKGYLALSDAFKCFFIETIELSNIQYRTKYQLPLSEFYALFLPRLVQNFQSLCGAERIAIRGYPYHGYTLLRNLFDSVVLTSAALQRITDFYSVEGLGTKTPADPKSAKTLRKSNEFTARRKMTGDLSGLSEETVVKLAKWDAMFDYETHGSLLSLTQATGWMSGMTPLRVLPQFEESAFALFINRFCEIGWMTHRLIPAVQPPGLPLPQNWKEKWRVIDQSFELIVVSLTKQCGKGIGETMVEFVKTKFPFDEMSAFPFENQEREAEN
jgi:hypothetical protein